MAARRSTRRVWVVVSKHHSKDAADRDILRRLSGGADGSSLRAAYVAGQGWTVEEARRGNPGRRVKRGLTSAAVWKRAGKKPATARRSVRRNPVRRVNHHLEGAVKMSGRVEAVLYRHAQSSTRAPYKHKFGPGVSMYALRDGSVLIKGPKPLWDVYAVEDSE